MYLLRSKKMMILVVDKPQLLAQNMQLRLLQKLQKRTIGENQFEILNFPKQCSIKDLKMKILGILVKSLSLKKKNLQQVNDLKVNNQQHQRRRRKMMMILMTFWVRLELIFPRKKRNQEVDQVQENDLYLQKVLNSPSDPEQVFKVIHLKMIKWENSKMHLVFDETLLQTCLNKTFQWVDQDEWINLLEEVLIQKLGHKPQVLKSKKNLLLESFKQAQADLIKEKCFQIHDHQRQVSKNQCKMTILFDQAQDQVLKKLFLKDNQLFKKTYQTKTSLIEMMLQIYLMLQIQLKMECHSELLMMMLYQVDSLLYHEHQEDEMKSNNLKSKLKEFYQTSLECHLRTILFHHQISN